MPREDFFIVLAINVQIFYFFFKKSTPQFDNLSERNLTGRDYVIEHAGRLGLRIGDWKYIEPRAKTNKRKQGSPMLFHLHDDLGENTNVVKKYPEKTAAMAALLEKIKQDGKTRF